MTKKREIAFVVRKVKLSEYDEEAERIAYWKTRTPEERFLEVEALRRLWPEITGDPDLPMELAVHRRKLGDPPIQRPPGVVIPRRQRLS